VLQWHFDSSQGPLQLFERTPQIAVTWRTWVLKPGHIIPFPPSLSTDSSALPSHSLPGSHFLPCHQITLFISKVIAEASFQLLSYCRGTGKGKRGCVVVTRSFCPLLCPCSTSFLPLRAQLNQHPLLCKQAALKNPFLPLTLALGLERKGTEVEMQHCCSFSSLVAYSDFAFHPKPTLHVWHQEVNLPKIQPSWNPPVLPGRSPPSRTAGPCWTWRGRRRLPAGKWHLGVRSTEFGIVDFWGETREIGAVLSAGVDGSRPLLRTALGLEAFSPESSTNCRVTGWLEVEGTLKGHLVRPPAMNRDAHSSISAHSPIQPDLGCLQGWSISHLSAQPVQCFTALIKHTVLGGERGKLVLQISPKHAAGLRSVLRLLVFSIHLLTFAIRTLSFLPREISPRN